MVADDAGARALADLRAVAVESVRIATVRIALATEDRDEAIKTAYADGAAVVDIARAAGLTRGRVYQILNPGSLVRGRTALQGPRS